ncbi:MAG: alpha/beta hydrolase [Brumimicrobium sp.]
MSEEKEIKFVQFNDLNLQYKVYGSGSTAVLCFHGHGKSADDFEFLSQPERKIISVNLFLHGESTFDESRIRNNLITGNDVEKLLENLFYQEKISDFHWVAYSQGGRFLLTVLPYFGSRVKSVHLLAPDGLNDKNFYSWSQRRWWARSLFKRWTKRPQELLNISRALSKGKIIRPKIVDFLEYYAEDKQKLTLAYSTWAGFRKLRPSTDKLKKTLNQQSIPFRLIIGEYDQIITKSSAEKFLAEINQQDALINLPFGHDLFREEVIPELKKLIKI